MCAVLPGELSNLPPKGDPFGCVTGRAHVAVTGSFRLSFYLSLVVQLGLDDLLSKRSIKYKAPQYRVVLLGVRVGALAGCLPYTNPPSSNQQ
jgi:hypothetical protein